MGIPNYLKLVLQHPAQRVGKLEYYKFKLNLQ